MLKNGLIPPASHNLLLLYSVLEQMVLLLIVPKQRLPSLSLHTSNQVPEANGFQL